MAIPQHVQQKLRSALGQEAAEDLVTWMDDIERSRSESAELRRNLQADIAELRQEMHTEIGELRQKMHTEIGGLRHDMQLGFAGLETAIERSRADLMKWSFVFWVGAVISIALLAKLLP